MGCLYYHLLPGRFRLHVPGLKGNYQLGETLEKQLNSLSGILQARANPVTGRALVFFKETKIKHTDIIMAIDTVLNNQGSVGVTGGNKIHKAFAEGELNCRGKQLYHGSLSVAMGALLVKHLFWGKTALSPSHPVQTIAAITTIIVSYPVFSSGFKKLAQTKRLNYELIASASILTFLLLRENYLSLGVAWLVSLCELRRHLHYGQAQQIISHKSRIINGAADGHREPALNTQLPQTHKNILSLSFLTASISYFITGNIQRSLVILVAAVPAAMNLGSYTAYGAAVAQARRRGIYVRGDSSMQRLAQSDVIHFDKTGSLTEADFVILADDPRTVSYLYLLTQNTRKVARQNNSLITAFGSAGILLGTAGFLNLVTAGIITNVAVITVLVNTYGLALIKAGRRVDLDLRQKQVAATTLSSEVLCEKIDWHDTDEVTILEMLYSDPGYGLEGTNRLYRLQVYGENELTVHGQTSLIKLFFEPFGDFMVRLLLAAGVASFIVGEVTDALIIGGIVLLEAILGVVQGYRSEKALQALKELSAPSAKVIIDGVLRIIAARELVLGDIILLAAGDQVPADARLLQAANLQVEEASLTGESLPVQKSAQAFSNMERNTSIYAPNMLYMGTSVIHGSATAVVVATGMQTKMGRMARMLQETEAKMTPLQLQLNDLGRKVSYLCIAACGCIVVLGLLRGQPKLQMVRLGISMAVGAIPEGLPAVVTIALAFGVHRMVKKNTIVRKLLAVETLGSSTIICTDKTGTITKNEMTVTVMYCNNVFWLLNGEQYYPVDGKRIIKGVPPNREDNKAMLQLLLISTLCNNATLEYKAAEDEAIIWGDPTEAALLTAAIKGGIPYAYFRQKYCRKKEMAFTSERKIMSVLCKDIKGEKILFTKGAPDKIIPLCTRIKEGSEIISLDQKRRQHIYDTVDGMASQALRVLALAYKPLAAGADSADVCENKLIFAGLVGLADPPKEGVKTALAKCHTAGLKVMMITGDHPRTAVAVADQVGLLTGGQVLTGSELEEMSDGELEQIIGLVEVCARTTPEHKLRIVRALKKKGHVVAMTGDGVNDAPAVKEADVGIAMGISGMEVTKEASSMVLTDDNFSSIVAAVEEGRGVANNIRNTIKYVLSGNMGEIVAILTSALAGAPLPLVPGQILFINIVTESIPAMALGAQPPDRNILNKSQADNNKRSIISGSLKNRIIFRGLLTGFITYGLYIKVFKLNGNLNRARTIAFSNLVTGQLFNYFRCNDGNKNPYLLPTAGISAALLLGAIYIPFLRPFFLTHPLHLKDWAIILTASLLANKTEDFICHKT